MTTEKKQLTTKEKTSGYLALVVIALIIAIAFTCGGGDEEEQVSSTDNIKLQQDSTDLIAHLKSTINLREGMTLEISEFNNKNCRIRMIVPVEDGEKANYLGIGNCTRAAKWLSDKNYTVGHEGIYTTCYVYSPDVGVTQKENMWTSWGHARYDANTAAVTWEWKK